MPERGGFEGTGGVDAGGAGGGVGAAAGGAGGAVGAGAGGVGTTVGGTGCVTPGCSSPGCSDVAVETLTRWAVFNTLSDPSGAVGIPEQPATSIEMPTRNVLTRITSTSFPNSED